MKLIKFAELLGSANVEEAFDRFFLEQKLPSVPGGFRKALFDALSEVSPRDSLEVVVCIGGSDLTVVSLDEEDGSKVDAHLADFDAEDEFLYRVRIYKKCIGGILSVYSFENFENFLAALPTAAALAQFSDRLLGGKGLVLEVSSFGEDVWRGPRLAFASPSNAPHVAFAELERESKLELHRDCTHVVGVPSGLLPADFCFARKPDSSKLVSCFERLSAALAICYLANNAELRTDDTIKFKISGYKSIVYDGDVACLSASSGVLCKIVDWAYEGGSGVDKLGLARNVLSIHVSPGGFSVGGEVWEAIRSNYQIYLNDNVQSYLEVKNKLGEMVVDSMSKSLGMVDDLLNGFKANVAVFMTFMLTVVVVNGVKDLSVAQIFSHEYMYVAICVSLFSVLWLCFSVIDLRRRFVDYFDGVDSLLVKNYERIIMRSEIDSVVSPTRQRCQNILDGRVRLYASLWILSAIAFVAAFLIGNKLVIGGNGVNGPASSSQGKSASNVIAPASGVPSEAQSRSSPALDVKRPPQISMSARIATSASGPLPPRTEQVSGNGKQK